ncbi:hypothetical protein SESBI_40130 [Sesbania bispinosa]|nr:hypothetical protein SESBI_40130 [Sesbania bispinosa]
MKGECRWKIKSKSGKRKGSRGIEKEEIEVKKEISREGTWSATTVAFTAVAEEKMEWLA